MNTRHPEEDAEQQAFKGHVRGHTLHINSQSVGLLLGGKAGYDQKESGRGGVGGEESSSADKRGIFRGSVSLPVTEALSFKHNWPLSAKKSQVG